MFALVCFRIGSGRDIGSVGNRRRRELTVAEHVLGYVLNQALREFHEAAGCQSWISRPSKLRSPLTV